MDALRDLTQLQYRQDIISNNLVEWILNGPSHSHSTLQGAFHEFSSQNMRLRPNALGMCPMLTPTPYIHKAAHLFWTLQTSCLVNRQ